MEPTRRSVWTIGHSSRSLDDFVALLREHFLERVVDIRRWPTSKVEHFRRDRLAQWLPEHAIEYQHEPRLGGYRKGGYETHMRTDEFAEGLAALEALAGERRTAFMCMEATPTGCHRKHVTRTLADRGWTVVHILGPGRAEEHREYKRQPSLDTF